MQLVYSHYSPEEIKSIKIFILADWKAFKADYLGYLRSYNLFYIPKPVYVITDQTTFSILQETHTHMMDLNWN